MSIAFNGSTGYLSHAAKIGNSFPFSMAVWVAGSTGVSNQCAIMQGQSNGDRVAMGWFTGFGATKQAYLRNPGSNNAASKTSAPDLSASTMRLMIVVFESTTSRSVYFGSNTPATDTVAKTDDITNHDRVLLGAYQINSGGLNYFLTGSVAEAHFFNRALTATDYDAMVAGTLPETLTNWIDGWSLQNYEAGGTYTSIGGTRTLTANGGVSASGLAHPITRSGDTTAPVLSSPVGTATGATTATVGATTDEGNGTMYVVVTTSLTEPSVAQIKAGQNDTGSAAAYAGNQSISSTGAKTFNAAGLTASTTYYAHLVHTDTAANDSNRVSSSSFVTSAPAAKSGLNFFYRKGNGNV